MAMRARENTCGSSRATRQLEQNIIIGGGCFEEGSKGQDIVEFIERKPLISCGRLGQPRTDDWQP